MAEQPRGPRKKRAPASDEMRLDLGMGNLFKGLGDFLDVISTLAEKAEQAGEAGDAGAEGTRRSGEINIEGLGDKAKAVYGFTVRSGIGGTPRVESFGNIKPTREGPVVDDVREPMVDSFDEGAEVVVVAELPGVAESEINVEAQDDILSLRTTGAYKYAKEVLLSSAVEPASLTRSYKNGILELRLKKKA
jgi:HSP20 family protein